MEGPQHIEPALATKLNDRRAIWLTVLAGAFSIRVAAQLLQRFVDVSFLPEFDSWRSGTPPYPALVASQFIILGAMVVVVKKVWLEQLSFNRPVVLALATLVAVYFVCMVGRMLVGLITRSGHRWWDARLPTFSIWCWPHL